MTIKPIFYQKITYVFFFTYFYEFMLINIKKNICICVKIILLFIFFSQTYLILKADFPLAIQKLFLVAQFFMAAYLENILVFHYTKQEMLPKTLQFLHLLPSHNTLYHVIPLLYIFSSLYTQSFTKLSFIFFSSSNSK